MAGPGARYTSANTVGTSEIENETTGQDSAVRPEAAYSLKKGTLVSPFRVLTTAAPPPAAAAWWWASAGGGAGAAADADGSALVRQLTADVQALVSGARVDVILIGSDTLTRRYSLALQQVGIACQSHGAEATWAGLHALASKLTSTP